MGFPLVSRSPLPIYVTSMFLSIINLIFHTNPISFINGSIITQITWKPKNPRITHHSAYLLKTGVDLLYAKTKSAEFKP